MMEQLVAYFNQFYEHVYAKVALGFVAGMAVGMLLERLGHTKKDDKK